MKRTVNTNETPETELNQPEPEVVTVVSSQDTDEPVKTPEADEDSLRKRVEDKYGDVYVIDKIVVDGDNVSFLGRTKDSDTSVAIRVED